MDEDDYSIADGDKGQQNANLEDEYGYEDEEEQQNDLNHLDNQDQESDNEANENEEGDEEDEEQEDDGDDEDEDDDNQGEDNNPEYDFGREESDHRNRTLNKKAIDSSDDDEEGDGNENNDIDDEDEEGDNGNNGLRVEGGKVRSRQVGKRGRFTRVTVSGQSKDGVVKKKDLMEREDDEDDDEADEIDNEDEESNRQNKLINSNNQRESNEGEDDGEVDVDEDDDDNDEEDEDDDDDELNQSENGIKLKKQKKNEFWKYRHKNKDENQPFKHPSSISHSQILNQNIPNINTSLLVVPQAEDNNPSIHHNLTPNAILIAHTTSTINYHQLNTYDEQQSLNFALERAAKFNIEILQQKNKVSQMLKFHEKNKLLQNKPVPIDQYGGNLFPQNVPINATTDEGWKYLLNLSSFCQKSTLEEFIHKNVQSEHHDTLADLKYGIKKQPMQKNKLIKKKLTKKSTFGGDIYD